jgi:riboflavin kinase/FMN adenylyltransferase
MRIGDGEVDRPGVASLGIRPTFEPAVELLEAHAFDLDEDLYGKTIEVDLVEYIRPEKKFDSLDDLAAAMRADEAEARRLLAVPE